MSSLFEKIGLGSVDIGYFIIGMMVVLLIILILEFVSMHRIKVFQKKYDKFMKGKNASSLEENILSLYEDNNFIKNSLEKNSKDIEKLYHKHQSAFQKLGLVKYDAFKEMGGRLSFSLAILDENNDGIIINSVHSSTGCYSYTKRVKKGDSEIPLSNEEKMAVEKAMGIAKKTTGNEEIS